MVLRLKGFKANLHFKVTSSDVVLLALFSLSLIAFAEAFVEEQYNK